MVSNALRAYSTVDPKGRTTIPAEIRAALKINAGDRLEYSLEGDRLYIRVLRGAASLAGSLASDKGKGLGWSQIREATAEIANAKRRRKGR